MKRTLTAVYWSHELRDVTTVTQEFEGTNEEIADGYFNCTGDFLSELREGNTVLYEKALPEWCECDYC